VLLLLVLHGVLVGFSAWWYSIAGYRLGGLNATKADWGQFWLTSRIAAPTVLPLLIVAIAGVIAWIARDRHITRANVLIPAWLCFAGMAFVSGGLFHRHYWVTLTFPLAAAAAVAIAPRGRERINGFLLIMVACLIALPSLISTERVVVLDRDEAALLAHADPRGVVDEQVGSWYRAHRTADSTIYVMCASAALYANANAIPPYPYLWLDGVQHGRDSQVKLVELFAGDNPPTFVAQYQRTSLCNPSGQVRTLLRDRYISRTVVAGARIFQLRSGVTADQLSGRNRFLPPT
jgi:hypothetical protein